MSGNRVTIINVPNYDDARERRSFCSARLGGNALSLGIIAITIIISVHFRREVDAQRNGAILHNGRAP